MVSIEHNPTHTQTEARPGEPGEIRPDGITRKKGRKNAGSLGVFARLLAGLTAKKTMPGTAGPQETSGLQKPPRLRGGLRGPGLPEALEVQETLDSGGIPAGGKKAKALRLAAKGPGEGGGEFPRGPGGVRGRKGPGDPAEPETLFPPGNPAVPAGTAPDSLRGFPESAPEGGLSENGLSLAGGGRYPGGINGRGMGREERPLPFRQGEFPENPPAAGDARNAALRSAGTGGTGKEEPEGKLRETREGRRAEKRRDRFSLDVVDLRTGTEAAAAPGGSPAEELRAGEPLDLVLELRGPGGQDSAGGHSGSPGTLTAEEGAARNFEQLLARELRGDLSADIVKQAAVVLRDGGEGTIRLSLRPESLGKVKIRLEMAENKISGHILVESEEALRAFEREIHTLEQSFRDSGFEASLSTALDYRNGGQQWKEEAASPFFSERLAAAGYEEESGDFPAMLGRPDYESYAVNVLA